MSSSCLGLVLIAKPGEGHLSAALYTDLLKINIRDDEPCPAGRHSETPPYVGGFL